MKKIFAQWWEALGKVLFKSLIQKEYARGKLSHERVEKEIKDKRKDHIKNLFIGKPVISITSKVDDLVVGFVVNYQNHVFTIKDYISQKEINVLTEPYYYNEKLLDGLLKLDCEQRWNIKTNQSLRMTIGSTKALLTEKETMEALKNNDFFKDLELYQQTKKIKILHTFEKH